MGEPVGFAMPDAMKALLKEAVSKGEELAAWSHDRDLFHRASLALDGVCPSCRGDGYTMEHSLEPGTHDENGGCLGYCPVQAQCAMCSGTGKVGGVQTPAASYVGAECRACGQCTDRDDLWHDDTDQECCPSCKSTDLRRY